ncbi:succinate dehydrogenase membrane anchor subunit [Pseudomonas sp. FW306-02-F02-AA]|uniref:Uncharacterized protein n=2 Tax=Pseudomonas TaxID=286 RepID=A0A0N9WIA2_PSEFL|nr:hypothetical protein AO353_13795 [Pseudomonas fluorescens]PMZ01064.1 succinate dehydrogenase membrane anchor subunit [Pseudomonas sp. FW306-02-F02-AB]PMZ06449.1 succinate dehydrogenase membrane anchor subunit [Pseudomonas sp. FW306-02-H06C]PMZ13805.1 succinate dehydrogenase membrane anchor subunit [Pseudomonas sp. FW306-02-F02-AA]PMZ19196.1 succinate dehydrogenase membrane anchor subunit [Pseudomonas sp. FW306-02-F08-AA]PMZ28458.1 succinate dehydrogenase membrane anchor subunit [Pseudomonas
MIVFLLIFLSQAIILFAAYFKLDHIEKYFIASHLVSINRKSVGNGPFGRMNRLRLIGALTGSFYQHQMLDPYAFMEAETLPTRLRIWVGIPRNLIRIAMTCAGLLLLWDGLLYMHTTITSPMDELKLLYTALLSAFLVLTLMILLLRAYISIFKLEELESHLCNSYFVGRNRRVMGNGLYGRSYRLSHLSIMLHAQDAFLLRCDPHLINDIKRLPLHLRRWIIISHRMVAYSLFGFFTLWGWGTYSGLLD